MSSSWRQRIATWVDGRLGWSRICAELARHRVPRRDVGTWLGGAALCSALLLVVTGALLLLHYRPSPAHAHGSVLQIDGAVPFGRIIRGIHIWSADLLVVTLCAYVFSLLVRRLHTRGGELVWLCGVLLALVATAEAYTGSLLPWSEQAHARARVGAELISQIPLFGSWLRRVLLGGEQLTELALGRAMGLHVGLLPCALTVLALCFALVRWARPPSSEAIVAASGGRAVPGYPDLLVRQAALWTGLSLVVATLATLVPRLPGAAGDLAVPTGAGVAPAWYLLGAHQVVRSAPATFLGLDGASVIVATFLLSLLLLLALPWLDRRGSRVVTLLAWCSLALFGILTAYGWLA